MRIVIVEDHLMFRDLIRKSCSKRFGIDVVGETDSGASAVELITRLQPDAAVLDLSLPDIDGFEVVEQVLKVHPTLRILIMSSHCDDYTLFRVERSRVHGFIDKNSNTVETLRVALNALKEGRVYYSAEFQTRQKLRRADQMSFNKVLTERERIVLGLIAQGMNDDEIGERLDLTPRTAQTHRSRLLRKLRVNGTPKLIAYAARIGFNQVVSRLGSLPAFP
ncbi:MAG: response regulator transcription factor [Opitutus sp.]